MSPTIELEKLVQNRIAKISVGNSTVRKQTPGTVAETREYLKSLELKEFADANSEKKFQEILSEHTNRLLKRMLKYSSNYHNYKHKQYHNPSWGLARKVLNIFLFEATHNKILNRKYDLDSIICFLELPLDNPNAEKLEKSVGKNLGWENIKSLTHELNEKIQNYAEDYAQKSGCKNRCYLELYLRDK